MRLQALREEVCRANQRLVTEGLVTLTWGNVSGFDADSKLMAIKPSGVDYAALTPASIVLVDLQGRVVEGDLRPSSDTPTHVLIYQHFHAAGVAGITHTHSPRATAFAQARRPLACLGTTHADHFHGPVPVTRPLTAAEVEDAYEANTGRVIVETFDAPGNRLDPAAVPGVLVAGHAPFAWGPSAGESVDNAVALEAVAAMNLHTALLLGGPTPPPLEDHVLEKHHRRKHGPQAYYGQPPGPGN
jgi:L-ribulose-5-phosphate 4-epimerase